MPSTRVQPGLVHFYYGYGCGKTSITLGHIVRCLGRNPPMKPILLQFLKKHDPQGQQGFFYGEFVTLTQTLNVPVFQYGGFNFVKTPAQIAAQKENVQLGLAKMKEVLSSGDFDLVILDEIGSVITLGLVAPETVVDLITHRAPHVEVMMTGHKDIPVLRDCADYVTLLKEENHPFRKGVQARPGIEY